MISQRASLYLDLRERARHRHFRGDGPRAIDAAAILTVMWTLAVSTLAAPLAHAQSLRGSSASLERQNHEAQRHNFTYIRDEAQLTSFVRAALLVAVEDGENFWLKKVSFPYARLEVKQFIERLASQYGRACGEQLVVTSLTRPTAHQPRNASDQSVHPTGMALDLRRSWNSNCRRWLEGTLLYLEERGVLEATYERRPIHYHIALFPRNYRSYITRLVGDPDSIVSEVTDGTRYVVRKNDNLWRISKLYGTTPKLIQWANDLRSSRIYPGQVLKIPVAGRDR